MLKVKTFLAESLVHGIGIFAGEDIPEKTAVWEFNPHVDLQYSCEEWQQLKESVSPESFAALERYSYKENNAFWLCLDNAQFMNHCQQDYNVVSESSGLMLARRDIKKGEELLCNYFQYSDCDDVHIRYLGICEKHPGKAPNRPS